MNNKMVEHYEIRDKIGQGGMANVFLAYDTHLEREVALKVLDAYFAREPEFASRFEREVKTITSLEHSHIVPVYDYGSFKGLPYLVMRFMRGGSLEKRLKKEPLTLTQTHSIIRRVAGALDYAHTNGIVHRDLKPDNILFDRENNAFLADFGIVKLVETSTRFTQTGNTLGTPAYMSPEQAKAIERLDHRSDIYSLGVILYEMLTGDIPYKADTNLGQAMMHVLEPVPRILAANPDLPSACDEIIQKAMAKDRNSRYTSTGEFAQALGAIIPERSQRTITTPADPIVDRDIPALNQQSPRAEVVREQPPPKIQDAEQQRQQPSPSVAEKMKESIPEADIIKMPDTASRKRSLLFMVPGITWMGVLQLLPILLLIFLSFNRTSLSEETFFVGLDNYARLFNDPGFWSAFRVLPVVMVSRSLVVIITWWILQRSWRNRIRLPLWLALLAVIFLPLFSPYNLTILWFRLLRNFNVSATSGVWIWVVVDALHTLIFSAAIGLVVYALGQNTQGKDTNAQLLSTVRNLALIALIAMSPNALSNTLTLGIFPNFSLALFNYYHSLVLLNLGYAATSQTLQVILLVFAALIFWRFLKRRPLNLQAKQDDAKLENGHQFAGLGGGLLVLGFLPGIILAIPYLWGLTDSFGPTSSLAEFPWDSWLLSILTSILMVWLVVLPLSWLTAYGLLRWNGSSGIFKSRIVFPFILSAFFGVSSIFVGQLYLLFITDGMNSQLGIWSPLIYSSIIVLAFVLFFDGLNPLSKKSSIPLHSRSLFLKGLKESKMMFWIIVAGIVATCVALRTYFWYLISTLGQRREFVSLDLAYFYRASSVSISSITIVMLLLAIPFSAAFGWATYKLLKEYSLSVEL